jgi:hypothetical protein
VSTKWKTIGVLVILLAVFLIGFVPQFMDRRSLQNQLEDAQRKVAAAELQMEAIMTRELQLRRDASVISDQSLIHVRNYNGVERNAHGRSGDDC